jgi:hypothetical protein
MLGGIEVLATVATVLAFCTLGFLLAQTAWLFLQEANQQDDWTRTGLLLFAFAALAAGLGTVFILVGSAVLVMAL